MKTSNVIGFLLVATLSSSIAFAQQRPLVTEDPETIGAGVVLIEAGFDYQRSIFYPASGLEGNLLRLPTLGVSFGLGTSTELQIDGGPYNHLAITSFRPAPLSGRVDLDDDHTSGIEDFVIATKLRLVAEGPDQPAVGLRFATKLPTASTESGLGLDTLDFYASTLIGKTTQSIRIVGNVGFGVLSDPTRGDSHNNVLTYGLSFARAVKTGVEIVAEVNGRADLFNGEIDAPPGTESRAAMRFGARATSGSLRVDGGIIIGMTTYDPSFGFTAGLTWVFKG